MANEQRETSGTFTREDLAEELVTLGDIAALLGRPQDTVQKWRDRHGDFPEPVAETIRARIYLRSEILAWLRKTDRLPEDEAGD